MIHAKIAMKPSKMQHSAQAHITRTERKPRATRTHVQKHVLLARQILSAGCVWWCKEDVSKRSNLRRW